MRPYVKLLSALVLFSCGLSCHTTLLSEGFKRISFARFLTIDLQSRPGLIELYIISGLGLLYENIYERHAESIDLQFHEIERCV